MAASSLPKQKKVRYLKEQKKKCKCFPPPDFIMIDSVRFFFFFCVDLCVMVFLFSVQRLFFFFVLCWAVDYRVDIIYLKQPSQFLLFALSTFFLLPLPDIPPPLHSHPHTTQEMN